MVSEQVSQIEKGGRPNGVAVGGDFVRRIRDELCLTQEQLAAEAGVSLRTINSIERSQRVSSATVRAIASALEVDVESLLLSRTKRPA